MQFWCFTFDTKVSYYSLEKGGKFTSGTANCHGVSNNKKMKIKTKKKAPHRYKVGPLLPPGGRAGIHLAMETVSTAETAICEG